MCCAQTGSGKTAAFLLPIINRLLQQQDTLTPAMTVPATPEALILAPTRELAIQIGKEANMYANGSMIKTQVVYGGTAIFSQKSRLMKGCNIMVATTGRLKQFITEKIVDVSKVKYFILDEADRMLDMGFMPDVQTIENRVSGMFSATFASDIQVAAKNFLGDYIYIVIGVVGGACTDVKQEILQVEKAEKRNTILEILGKTAKNEKVLVFCASKKGADFLASYLSGRNHSCTSIHGDRLQSQREMALLEFTTGKRQVLVATAVAARGLDIPKVAMVINYDLPNEIDECRQDVPDFLDGRASNGYGGGFEEGGFSSVDVRKGSAPAAAEADDDDW
ncbi:ATP-dependent RNA helicase vasa, isoform A [Orchesella cincta]|uniref:RNA helicase n=1 Tax=Orchesella cincta TaxID=48709 RepID=A0A1D2MYN5_ORCCI|nr:ATP-dependent RNA helicase vasa, isoform A [Orchesella cincta]